MIGDTLEEPDETFTVSLGKTSALLAHGSPSTITVTVVDDDEGGQLRFNLPEYEVAEGAGQITIEVERVSGEASNVTVRADTAPGTATEVADFTDVSATLSFGAGVREAFFQVPIRQDNRDEPDETILLALTNPTGGATLGSIPTARITILDDDLAGEIFADGFESGNVSAWDAAAP